MAAVAEEDDLDLDPALAACVQLGLAGPHALPPEPVTRPPLTVSLFGTQLHAATTVDGRDRKQLERLCRYMLRPPFAHDAVKAFPDGRVRVLLARVFAVDVTVCRKCGGHMHILEVVHTPDAVARVLHGARAPPRPPPPGQLLLLR